jgi:hypothetical protein
MRSVGALRDTLPCLMTTAASVLLALSVAAAPARAQGTFPFPSPDRLQRLQQHDFVVGCVMFERVAKREIDYAFFMLMHEALRQVVASHG